MSFNYPLGLLGLIGIPIVIIIYIIKNKHTEQFVPSTYLWELSENFLKKKKQLPLLSGLISLILQIIAITAISLLIAHPIITIPSVANDYCFILDASGSMNALVNDVTKFELGKEEITEIISQSRNGSTYTLLSVGDTTQIVYENLDDADKAIELLKKLNPSDSSVSFNNTIKYVQEYFNKNRALVTYLVTDQDYESNNINVINVSKTSSNYALSNVKYTNDKNKIDVEGIVTSYGKDSSVTISIFLDDNLVKNKEIIVKKDEPTPFEETIAYMDFTNITVEITNKDSLLLDNKQVIYNLEKEHNYSTLIVSNNPFYLTSMLETVGSTSVQVISPKNYHEDISGFSLYIFDSFAPTKLPTDGTIWLFGVETSIDGAGFSVQNVLEDENGLKLTYPKNSTSLYKTLTKDLLKDDIYVSRCVKYGLYRNFTTLLTYEGNPVVFTGTTEKGNREVVFGFDLHNSNLPLLLDYLLLSKNLLDFSFPTIIDKPTYTCLDKALINVLGDFDSIRVESPKGNISYLDISSSIAELELKEVGVYKLSIMANDEIKEFFIYSCLEEEESKTNHDIIELSLQGKYVPLKSDGIYEKLIIYFIILTVIIVADWMVYCYEQHQLR